MLLKLDRVNNKKKQIKLIIVSLTRSNPRERYSISTISSMLNDLAQGGNIGLYLCVCGGAAEQQSRGASNAVIASNNFGTTTAEDCIQFLKGVFYPRLN